MRTASLLLGLLLLLVGWLTVSSARQERKDVVHTPVVTIRDSLTPRQALREVRRQTNIAVADSLPEDAPELSLDLAKVSFWRAIDAIAVGAKAKAIQSSRDGS